MFKGVFVNIYAEGLASAKEWKLQDDPPVSVPDQQLRSLEADGNELAVVAKMFPALCPLGLTSGYWYGDVARTILGCLAIRRVELFEEANR